MRTLLYLSPSFGRYSISTTIARQHHGGIDRPPCMPRKHAKEPETVRLSSNEGNNMKGARRRKPVRTKRIIRLTLIASAFYAVFAVRCVFAQPSQSSSRNASAFDRPDSSWASSSSGYLNREGGENSASDDSNTRPQKSRSFDGRVMRAQHRMGKQPGNTHAQQMPVMQPPPPDPQPPERPPRHGVMTADERRLLRQHIEEAVRDLYKR
ncbi:hypothetical protein AWB64_04094 [Caballeronia sordidicola]|uniref:Transmembrane protein n=2 Tax=Caballeronia sordidicola TaxID=196367 RepID=A0A158H487_CABSO|nr:hypothetical protein AWB64_04094 [Caballeronia sordidicola]